VLSQNLENFTSFYYARAFSYLRKIRKIDEREDKLIFKVRGTREYDVTLESESDDILYAYCSCPAFARMDECKHVAACILFVEHTPFARKFGNSVTYLGSSFLDEKLEIEQGSQLKKVLSFLGPDYAEDATEIFPTKIRIQPAIDEIWYGLHMQDFNWIPVEVRVDFRSRSMLKSGKLSKLKQKKLKFSDLSLMKSSDDKIVFEKILPFITALPSSRGELLFEYAYIKGESSDLLTNILKTGRAYISRGYYQDDEIIPITLEESYLIEVKLKTSMEEQTMQLALYINGEELEIISLDEVTFLWDSKMLLLENKAYFFETYLGQDLFSHLKQEGEILFTKEDFEVEREAILSSIDHRAIAGDTFGLSIEEVDIPLELHLKLPLGLDQVQARLISQIPPKVPPFNFLTIPKKGPYQEIKEELETLSDSRIDADGFFLIPIGSFQKTITKSLELNVSVRAEKALIKSADAFNMSINHGMNWFEINGSVSIDEKEISLPEILKRVKEGSDFIEFKKGELTYLPKAWLDKVKKISELAVFQDGKYVVHVSRAQQLESLEVPSTDLSEFLHKLRKFKSLVEVKPSKKFKGKLRDYQAFGLSWMQFLREVGLGGCLADDMGLGKTVQVAANLQLRKYEKKEANLSLVICPKSLVFNWKNELQKFAPDLKVEVHEAGEIDLASVSADVLITTYGLLQRNCEHYLKRDLDYIILDEAQAIKNPRALTSKAIFTLKSQHRLALTGTPIENHIGEFYSIFNFLMPGIYKKEAMNPNQANVSLAKALKPFVLRRTKKQVLKDLPPKIEQVIYCDQKPEEKKHYNELREFITSNLNKKIEIDNFKKSSIMVLEALTRLRQASCHPGLINPALIEIPTGKLEQLQIMLEEILQEGHKVVIFSQFTTLLKLVRTKLGFSDSDSVYLDGSSQKREALVDDFRINSAKNVFFISLKAGGTGLNLVEASYCFLLDPWWNPAVEDQAMSRLHRIGQKKSVNVYRFITKGSIEEKVLELQKVKKDIVADVLDETSEGFLRSLTSKDLEFLLH
jgi:SNF2 family DNA or RNA helicase